MTPRETRESITYNVTRNYCLVQIEALEKRKERLLRRQPRTRRTILQRRHTVRTLEALIEDLKSLFARIDPKADQEHCDRLYRALSRLTGRDRARKARKAEEVKKECTQPND